jgi:hypothetical protein
MLDLKSLLDIDIFEKIVCFWSLNLEVYKIGIKYEE